MEQFGGYIADILEANSNIIGSLVGIIFLAGFARTRLKAIGKFFLKAVRCICRKFRGVPKDPDKNFEDYLRAAEQGDAKSQFHLGVMYENGWGVKQNYETAMYWYHEAAEQGHAEARYSLGVMYWGGIEEDEAEAYMWFYLAAQQGYGNAKQICERLESTLSRKQIKEAKQSAKKLLKKWRASKKDEGG